MTLLNLPTLVEAVQKNCHITDARFARDKSLCTYLLEMRELFRWENDIPFSRQPVKEELGDWITRREALWDELEDAPFESLPVSGKDFEPFDIDAINRELVPQGLVYGAGYGRFHKPHFFLGRLLRQEERDGVTVVVSECEYARDIASIPAAMQNGVIYLRHEALRRWLREKIELWELKKSDGALKAALDCYGIADNEEAALDRMLAQETETVILHEIGEVAAEHILGAAWKEMMANLSDKRREIFARAVCDNLADCVSTLPTLMEQNAECSLHFYFANLDGTRRALFPRLTDAYRKWHDDGDLSSIKSAVAEGRVHWAEMGLRLLDCYRAGRDGGRPGTDGIDVMEKLERESAL